MKTLNLIQGTPEWSSHRASHFNASDAPSMLGCSPFKTRTQLLRECATGVAAEVDAATQARFDAGHRFEALARPLAEKIVGEDLYPCVGVYGKWSASFDGLTLTGEVAWEHKSVNAELRELIQRAEGGEPIHADHLPEHYRIQMDHQALVSGAGSVLFMATRWEGDELVEQFWCWYSPNAQRQMRIAAGWEQFERDLADYVPEPAEALRPVGRTPETLPALRIEARGMVTASNLAEFKEHALAVLGGINRTLVTDEDFANAESTVKWCAGVEDRLAAAKSNVLGQMADVDAVCRTIDDVAAETRRIRLELDRLVKAEKESRRAALVSAGLDAIRAHYDRINATLGEHAMQFPTGLAGGVGQSIKGLKTLSSMRAAIDSVVAEMKIDASQKADMVRACMAVFAEGEVWKLAHLFPDRVMLCATKQPEDLRNLVAARISDHQRREEQRIREAEERGRQMAEIAAQRQAEVQTAAGAPAAQKPMHGPANNAGLATGSRNGPSSESVTRGSQPPTRIKLGDINAAIAPLSITADGLAQLGFPHVATDKAAKLYDEASFEPILSALAKVIARADLRREAA